MLVVMDAVPNGAAGVGTGVKGPTPSRPGSVAGSRASGASRRPQSAGASRVSGTGSRGQNSRSIVR